MAEVLGQMVKATFETHMYKWDGNIYSQTEGCPTGLRVSGPISRMTMDKWVIELQKIEELSKALTMINPVQYASMKTLLLEKYVDDVLYGGESIPKGTKWDKSTKTLIWSHEQEKTDRESETPDDQRSMKIIAQIASSIFPWLQFTWDAPSANPNMTLDTQMLVKEQSRERGIPQEFQKKPPNN